MAGEHKPRSSPRRYRRRRNACWIDGIVKVTGLIWMRTGQT